MADYLCPNSHFTVQDQKDTPSKGNQRIYKVIFNQSCGGYLAKSNDMMSGLQRDIYIYIVYTYLTDPV